MENEIKIESPERLYVSKVVCLECSQPQLYPMYYQEWPLNTEREVSSEFLLGIISLGVTLHTHTHSNLSKLI